MTLDVSPEPMIDLMIESGHSEIKRLKNDPARLDVFVDFFLEINVGDYEREEIKTLLCKKLKLKK